MTKSQVKTIANINASIFDYYDHERYEIKDLEVEVLTHGVAALHLVMGLIGDEDTLGICCREGITFFISKRGAVWTYDKDQNQVRGLAECMKVGKY